MITLTKGSAQRVFSIGSNVISETGFIKFIYSGWFFYLIYSIVFYQIGSPFLSMIQLLNVVLLTPISFILEKLSFKLYARVFYILSCNITLVATNFGFGHSIKSEYYLIPLIFAPIITIESQHKNWIKFCVALPLLSFFFIFFSQILNIQIANPFIPNNPSQIILLNSAGAIIAMLILVRLFHKFLKTQQDKIVLSNKMKSLGSVTGQIVHEINNPLTILNLKIEMLKNHIGRTEPNYEYVKLEIKKVESLVERINFIVRGLQTLKLSSYSQAENLQSVTVNHLLELALEICQSRLKNIKLTTEIGNNITVKCRPTQIAQVLVNLINNAVDATENTENPWVFLAATTNQTHILISVKDSGRGLSQEVLSKLMTPFFTTKQKGNGTGLGLSVSKAFAEKHGGFLKYDEQSTHTQFILGLPI